MAVSAALAVVEPNGSGMAGGFYLLHRANDGHQVAVDAREVAPAAATRDMFLDAAGCRWPSASSRPSGSHAASRRWRRMVPTRSIAALWPASLWPATIGHMHVVTWDVASGEVDAASDPRWVGGATVR